MTTEGEVIQYIDRLINSDIQVPRLKSRTAQQYKTVWMRFAPTLTSDEKADVRNVDSDLPHLTKRLESVFPGVKNETLHAYALGIKRCITLALADPSKAPYLAATNPEVATSKIPSLQTTSEPPAGPHSENPSLRAENERLQLEVKQLQTEVRRLKVALSALVEPGP